MLDRLVAALESTGVPFKEAAWDNRPAGDYGVYMIDSSPGSVWADGHAQSITLEGTIDLYTRSSGDAKIISICKALNSIDGVSWKYNAGIYEDGPRMMHHEFVFSYVVDLKEA